jgi:UDP-N-acetylglucosamine diphosphorylase / glucose-1-phosphate thymidylyltransferase / UDP-N-acetylgalactosamine diphosphorylase / glucosamine-1-phosphate N-acetyltransferase / galactosamine-1-phosphate N-acetyltransferase
VRTPTLYLFDDRQARRWAPLTLTRPVGELLFGCLGLRERAERVLGAPCAGHLTRKGLAGFDEPGAAPTLRPDEVRRDGVRVFLCSRAILDFQHVEIGDGPARIVVDGRTAGWVVPDGAAAPSELWLSDPDAAPSDVERLEPSGYFLERPWDLVSRNEDRIALDVAELWPSESDPPGLFRVGDHSVSVAEGAVVEPGVHVDVRGGPIRVAEGARVEGPARIVGPLFVGPGSTVLGGTVGTSSIGPACLVRGEVAHSVLLGFVNKAHDGHLGHALVGRWVNLGAFTTNSDLKNNYRTVRVWTPDGEHDTGLLKVGCFIGDHVKTGIGTVLNTGTVIGAGSNVFGGLMPPTVVPPFSWGAGADLRDHRFERFVETAQRVMARRGQEMTPGVRDLLANAWKDTAGRRAE